MNLPDLNLLNILLAAAPLLAVLYLMMWRNWGGAKAGPAGFVVALVVSLLFFGANLPLILVSIGKAFLLALFVLYIIWMALLFYHVVDDAGVIAAMSSAVGGLARNRASQALLVAWLFGSFLQGASGFGVPAAVVAPLLLGLGFAPNVAVVIALLGHGWAVTFGSLGNSFNVMVGASGYTVEFLATESSLLLALCCFACGILVLWWTGKWAALRSAWAELLIFGLLMAATQWALAEAGLFAVAALGGGMVGLLAGMLFYQRQSSRGGHGLSWSHLRQTFLAYIILTIIILLGELVLDNVLDAVIINPVFPEVVTSFGWLTPAGTGRSINLFGHAGALLFYSGIVVFLYYRWQGPLNDNKDYAWRPIWQRTVKRSKNSTISIMFLMGMAIIMQHAGMTQLLAEMMSEYTGRLFPTISPVIGALGAIMTGSNTNSNVLFTTLQQQTALSLGLAVAWILASQTAGGAIGSVFAPAKVIVGCSTVADADSGTVLRLAVTSGGVIILLLAVVMALMTMFGVV